MSNVIFSQTSSFIWTYVFLPLLLICAVILTIGCRFLQFRHFGLALKCTIGKAFTKQPRNSKALSPFQAASAALGSTVGTGNIVGTAQAISMGGPGALFWLLAAALISMIVKYAEILLAIHYRKALPGHGPMDYIEHGLRSKKLALCYAFLALLSSLAMGNISQASSITDAFINAANSFIPGPDFSGAYVRLAVGLLLCAMTVLLLSGGMKRIGAVAQAVVPFMVVLFISVSLLVIIRNIKAVPGVLQLILAEAFSPGSICGGAAGLSTAQCIQWGLRRSAFSNEAGLGTSAIAHASADTESAAEQGLWGIFEVFADTVVICSCTALCILCSGIYVPWGELAGSELFTQAVATVFGDKTASALLALFIGLFAYTSIMGWALYGSRCADFLLGKTAANYYHFVFCGLLILGSIMPLELVWQISDLVNALMSIPNLSAVLLLSPIVCRISRDSFS